MQPTHVLVIDDSKLITKLVTKALLTNKIKNHHFTPENIYIAHDGMQAFEILGKNKNISLVISDVMMPILNGEELIEILIDIGKIDSLELYFITTPNVATSMSPTSKEYSVGIIHKPFNDITFCEQVNILQLQYKTKVQKQTEIKLVHEKQKRHICTWIDSYFAQKGFILSTQILLPFVESEFKHYNTIDNDELYMMLSSILENYFAEIKSENIIDFGVLREIYNSWHKPDAYSSLDLENNFQDIITHAKEILEDTSTKEEIQYALIHPINHILSLAKKNIKHTIPLCYDDFFPYFFDLIELLSKLDANFQTKRVLALISHIDEIQNMKSKIFNYTDASKIVEVFPIFKENKKTLSLLQHHFKHFYNQIQNELVPYYVYEVNSTLWNQAKSTPVIANYLKEKLKNKMPNTHNALYYFKKIEKEEMKKFIKYDKVKIGILSNNRELLSIFKNKLTEHLPLLEISVHTNAAILQSSMSITQYNTLIIDLDFQDTVFNNGLQLFNYFQKKVPPTLEITNNKGIYFLASAKQVEVLHKKATKTDYNILLKPINEKNIYNKMFWES